MLLNTVYDIIDCFLERVSAANIAAGKAPPKTIGLAFDEKMIEEVPMETHDKELDMIITPSQIYST